VSGADAARPAGGDAASTPREEAGTEPDPRDEPAAESQPTEGAVPAAAGGRLGVKARTMAWVAGPVLVLDLITKAWVVRAMTLYESVPVLGDVFRLTYTHNPGAAFGINVGEHSRLVFLALALTALGILLWLYATTPGRRRFRLVSLALVAGGAVGNIVDRIRYERGVVDFLDVGIGTLRWPVFNVADMAVSVGAVLLLVSFYRESHDGEEPGG